jgi:hypothetical protein
MSAIRLLSGHRRWFDMRDLGAVLDHEGLHPACDQLQDHQRSVAIRRRDETRGTATAKFEGTTRPRRGGPVGEWAASCTTGISARSDA